MMMRDVIEWTKSASLDELRAVNRVVVLKIREEVRVKARQALGTFHIGQKVKFFHVRTGWVTCTITKLNVKTATVQEIGSIRGYRVSPSILQAME